MSDNKISNKATVVRKAKQRKTKARRINGHELYGITRKEVENTKGWYVAVYHVVETLLPEGGKVKKQKALFDRVFFADDPEIDDPKRAEAQSLAAAKKYRDLKFAEVGKVVSWSAPKVSEASVKFSGKSSPAKSRVSGEMYGITRDERLKTPTLKGFKVRVRDKPSKYFMDKAEGGEAGALRKAKDYRDQLVAECLREAKELAETAGQGAAHDGQTGVKKTGKTVKFQPFTILDQGEASKLKKARIKMCLSQESAAKIMGVTALTFSRMENAKAPGKSAATDEAANGQAETGVTDDDAKSKTMKDGKGEASKKSSYNFVKMFTELFLAYTQGKLNPEVEVDSVDLFAERQKLNKTQTQMSHLITGSNSQNPWAAWEKGRTHIQPWVMRYIVLIGLPKIRAKLN